MIELASFDEFDEIRLTFLEQLAESIGIVLNTIAANMRTEELLKQIAGAHREPAVAAGGAHRDQQAAGAADPLAAEVRGAAPEAAGRAAADQRRAGGQGAAARRAEGGGGAEEPGGRAGQGGAGGEGRAARPDLQVQVRVPGQHVARAPDAAQQPADPVADPDRERRRQPDRQAGRVRPDHPQLGLRPARPDQRHPRPVQDRVRHDGGGHQRRAVRARSRKFVESTFRQMADLKGLHFEVDVDPDLPPALQTDTKRLQQVLKNLLSNAFKFTERGSVALKAAAGHRRLEPGAGAAQRRQRRGRLLRDRHRHRHPQGEARRHLRGVPAGRHRHQPEVRRHRARPLDQPRDRPAARRRDPDRERAGRGQHVHALPAGRCTRCSRLRRPRPGTDGRRRARPPPASRPSRCRRPARA